MSRVSARAPHTCACARARARTCVRLCGRVGVGVCARACPQAWVGGWVRGALGLRAARASGGDGARARVAARAELRVLRARSARRLRGVFRARRRGARTRGRGTGGGGGGRARRGRLRGRCMSRLRRRVAGAPPQAGALRAADASGRRAAPSAPCTHTLTHNHAHACACAHVCSYACVHTLTLPRAPPSPRRAPPPTNRWQEGY